MVELVCFVRRRPGMSAEAFHTHWRDRHGPLVRDNAAARRYVRRYEQHHRVARDYDRPDGPAFDGVAVQWFESFRDFVAMITDPAFEEIVDDEARFLDRAGTVFVMTEPAIVLIDDRAQR
jgi:uncharacterized protein (TIGR02118 family)